ncbi:CDGSH iron-sulfur domain-containing protein [Nitratiruptor sp. YY09-18]|uniref:CDGSH iron-sulfur domain-containing protein n=1 Tax=Nitratiruptor sp. YY09-18 TaxID=2724901 RepID=UPI0019166B6D|nr:CDGSH iron-sulfur domain-containing protein [Nitratiruptor sp. YY09-18]BCD68803.1 hypothetical protein NitYY0918_C1720 [Nitratiruptor sp. YY09-18]
MARLVKMDEEAPLKLETAEKTYFICQCGLSKNKPFCDGNHKRVKDEEEDKIYIYDEEGRITIKP